MSQVIQLAGALMILAPFAAAQFERLPQRSYPYLLLNLAGSAILALLAFGDRQWGFFLLEAVWALVSLWGMLSLMRGSVPAPAGD